MPSVEVVWKGSCQDSRARQKLLGYLQRLALRSEEYLRHRRPERPQILNVMNEQRSRGLRARSNIESIDQEISGTILVSSLISPHPEALIARAREAGLQIVGIPETGSPAISISNPRVRGFDFKLFDPRGLYPAADRMSFVFLDCPEYRCLDGRLVEIATRADSPASNIASLNDADYYLRTPSIHLRYYLEDWTDCLFSWIKFFFIGDFWWQRWEEMQGYADYRQVFEELQAERGTETAAETAFDAVLATFSQHAEHWIGEVEGWAKVEQG